MNVNSFFFCLLWKTPYKTKKTGSTKSPICSTTGLLNIYQIHTPGLWSLLSSICEFESWHIWGPNNTDPTKIESSAWLHTNTTTLEMFIAFLVWSNNAFQHADVNRKLNHNCLVVQWCHNCSFKRSLHTESNILDAFLLYLSSFPIKNACYRCQNTENRTWSELFYDGRKFWRQCVNVIDNVRSYLFFNEQKLWTLCAKTLRLHDISVPYWLSAVILHLDYLCGHLIYKSFINASFIYSFI